MDSGRLDGSVITRLIKAGSSYEALAVELDISPSVVRQMEHGYLPRRRREGVLTKLALLARTSVSALMLPQKAKTA